MTADMTDVYIKHGLVDGYEDSDSSDSYSSVVQWTKSSTEALIKAYKNYPCLWSKASKYSGRDEASAEHRMKAYNQLLQQLKSRHPNLNIKLLKRKINSFRSQYRREIKELESRTDEDGCAVQSNLWCFNLLSFLNEENQQGENLSCADHNLDEEDDHYGNDEDMKGDEEDTGHDTSEIDTLLYSIAEAQLENHSYIDWSKYAIFKLIREYKARPCLWDVTLKAYRNKSTTFHSYKQLTEVLREILPGLTIEAVKKKINVLRTSYRREYLKLMNLNISRFKEGKPFISPRLWWFKEMDFVADIPGPKKAPSLREISNEKGYHVMTGESDHDQTSDPTDPGGTSSDTGVYLGETRPYDNTNPQYFESDVEIRSPPLMHQSSESPMKKRKSHSFMHEHKFKAHQAVEVVSKDEDDASCMAKVVETELRKMEPQQRIIAKKLIYDVIFNGNLETLKPTGRIVCE